MFTTGFDLFQYFNKTTNKFFEVQNPTRCFIATDLWCELSVCFDIERKFEAFSLKHYRYM